MNALLYVLGTLTVMVAVLAISTALVALAHGRTTHDHGPGCWWWTTTPTSRPSSSGPSRTRATR